jgi:16S rRNA (cytidine1402-2'-O)-methyltransferase
MSRHPLMPAPVISGFGGPAAADAERLEPGLYVVATPIGNLRDITLRALDVLGGADLVLAEDTRVTRKLFAAFGLSTPLKPYNDHSGEAQRASVLEALAGGARVALVSDAGTPLVSDPGFKLVRAVIAAGHRVFPLPGASAALAALSAAGLPTDRFLFLGFLPPKDGARRTALSDAAPVRASLVIFESGPRLADTLKDAADILGPREGAICRELTKLFEEIRRGQLGDLAAHYAGADAPKGEIVVVIGPPTAAEAPDAAGLDAMLRLALQTMDAKTAVTAVAASSGAPKREVYARMLALTGKADGG